MNLRAAAAATAALAPVLVQACASGPTAPTAAGGPATRPDEAKYPGPCPPTAMVVETLPSTGRFTSPDGRGTWTDEVVAVYRPGARNETELRVRVRHEQAEDLSSRVDQRTEFVCGSEAGVEQGEPAAPQERPAPPMLPPREAGEPPRDSGGGGGETAP